MFMEIYILFKPYSLFVLLRHICFYLNLILVNILTIINIYIPIYKINILKSIFHFIIINNICIYLMTFI